MLFRIDDWNFRRENNLNTKKNMIFLVKFYGFIISISLSTNAAWFKFDMTPLPCNLWIEEKFKDRGSMEGRQCKEMSDTAHLEKSNEIWLVSPNVLLHSSSSESFREALCTRPRDHRITALCFRAELWCCDPVVRCTVLLGNFPMKRLWTKTVVQTMILASY